MDVVKGFDMPTLEALLLLRPTKSKGMDGCKATVCDNSLKTRAIYSTSWTRLTCPARSETRRF